MTRIRELLWRDRWNRMITLGGLVTIVLQQSAALVGMRGWRLGVTIVGLFLAYATYCLVLRRLEFWNDEYRRWVHEHREEVRKLERE